MINPHQAPVNSITLIDILEEIPPGLDQEFDEPCLTFPIGDPKHLQPFYLEHRIYSKRVKFELSSSMHETLMSRNDVDLQLRCFNFEDSKMETEWPETIRISLNGIDLGVEYEDDAYHEPVYLKEDCQPGRNDLEIEVVVCCCSYIFTLQFVHRPAVRLVLDVLMQNHMLSSERSKLKIKQNFADFEDPANRQPVQGEHKSVSLTCPITFKRLEVPSRGRECKHLQCFDLVSYLIIHGLDGNWDCPVCNKPARLEELEIDEYMLSILLNLACTKVEVVAIHPSANWKAIPFDDHVESDGSGGSSYETDTEDTMGETDIEDLAEDAQEEHEGEDMAREVGPKNEMKKSS